MKPSFLQEQKAIRTVNTMQTAVWACAGRLWAALTGSAAPQHGRYEGHRLQAPWMHRTAGFQLLSPVLNTFSSCLSWPWHSVAMFIMTLTLSCTTSWVTSQVQRPVLYQETSNDRDYGEAKGSLCSPFSMKQGRLCSSIRRPCRWRAFSSTGNLSGTLSSKHSLPTRNLYTNSLSLLQNLSRFFFIVVRVSVGQAKELWVKWPQEHL